MTLNSFETSVASLRPRVLAVMLLAALPGLCAQPVLAQIAPLPGISPDLLSLPLPLVANDVCFDPAAQSGAGVFLAVVGHGDLLGAFADRAGRLISTFRFGNTNRNAPFGQYPRCVYSAELNGGRGGFLVAWQQNDGLLFVHSAVIAYPTGQIPGSEQIISDGADGGTFGTVPVTALAYSPTSHRILVAWSTWANHGTQGRFVNAATGVPFPPPVLQLVPSGSQSPALAWNPGNDTFGLAYAGFGGTGAWIGVRQLRASDGAVLNATTFGFNTGTFTPAIVVNTATNHFVVGWSLGPGARKAELDENGNLIAGSEALLSPRLGSPVSLSMAFNPVSGTILAVSEDTFNGPEAVGIELGGNGTPSGSAGPLTSGSKSAPVPRVTSATDAKHWNISFTRNFNTLADQIVTTSSAGGAGAAAPLRLISLTTDVALPAAEGMPITWTVTASGGTAPLQYKFLRYSGVTNQWSVLQDYGASNRATWFPPAGNDAVQVWVRSANSTAPYDAYLESGLFTITAPTPKVTSLTSGVAFPAAFGAPITFTATATSPGGALEYQFVTFSSATNAWAIRQAYSASNTFTWFPPAGNNVVQVWVRRVGQTGLYEDWGTTGFFTVTAGSPARITSFTSNVSFPVSPGTAVIFSTAATGGTGSLEYRFVRLDASLNQWSILRDWSPSSSATWTPGVANTGSQLVQVWVRSVGAGVTYEDWKTTGFFNVTDVNSVSLTLTSGSLTGSTATSTLTWLAQANSSNAGPWEYQFVTFDGTIWRIAQPYSILNQFTWTPGTGTRVVQVWVRAQGSHATYEAWNTSGIFVVQ